MSNLSITVSDAFEQFFMYVCRHTAASFVILSSGLYAEMHNQTHLHTDCPQMMLAYFYQAVFQQTHVNLS